MKKQAYISVVWHQFKKNKLACASLVFLGGLFLLALCAPILASGEPFINVVGIKVSPLIPYGPGTFDLEHILEAPSSLHWLGTDGDGKDVAAQLIWGARVSLSVGFVAVGIAVFIGVIFGALAGFYGGIIDVIVSRFIEVMMCFPVFFLVLAVLAFVGPSIYNIMFVIGITGWTGVARLLRGEILKFREREFVTAARALGASDVRIILRHLLPCSIAPVLVVATFGVASAILVEASLSFLGFGVPPQDPSWGSVLSQAQQFMDIAWWLTLAPGFAIFTTITAYNLVGEGLRDAIDPNLKL